MTVPVDKGICNTTTPHNNTDPDARVSTCNIMPFLAQDATTAATNILNCTSSPYPDCSQVTCTVLSNNDSLVLQLLPCYEPPAISLINTDARGSVLFNWTGDASASSVVANIGGSSNILNISIVQHGSRMTIGLMVGNVYHAHNFV